MRISPDDIQLANSALGVEDAITLARAHRMHAPKNRARFPRAMLDMLAKQKKVRFIGRSGVAFISEAVAAEAIKAWYAAEERELFGDGGGMDRAPEECADREDALSVLKDIRQSLRDLKESVDFMFTPLRSLVELAERTAVATEDIAGIKRPTAPAGDADTPPDAAQEPANVEN